LLKNGNVQKLVQWIEAHFQSLKGNDVVHQKECSFKSFLLPIFQEEHQRNGVTFENECSLPDEETGKTYYTEVCLQTPDRVILIELKDSQLGYLRWKKVANGEERIERYYKDDSWKNKEAFGHRIAKEITKLQHEHDSDIEAVLNALHRSGVEENQWDGNNTQLGFQPITLKWNKAGKQAKRDAKLAEMRFCKPVEAYVLMRIGLYKVVGSRVYP